VRVSSRPIILSGATTIQALVSIIGFTVAGAASTIAAPLISFVTPPNGLPADQITIVGSGFGSSRERGQVWLGTAYGVIQSWSDSQVVAVVAANSNSGTVRVLQSGVWSNAFPFIVNNPQIECISSGSGLRGTTVTFSGSGFGSYGGDGVVWLGSASGQVIAWNETQVIALVAANALTAIARIQRNGRWSNALPFSVPGGEATLQPNLMNLVMGALNSSKKPVTGLRWTSSDPAVVSLSAEDPPLLTAMAAGHATIMAGGASTVR
jgi:hypothetical protein